MSELPQRVYKWHRSGSEFSHRRSRIFYRQDGAETSPVLVLLHGFPTSSFDWIGLWPQLRQQFHLIAMDFLGFGFSDKPKGHIYTIAEQADIQLALLRHLGISRFHILAHDYGTTVAQELLARLHQNTLQPQEKIDTVTLLNGGILPDFHQPRPIQKLLLSPFGWLVARLLNQRRFSRAFAQVFSQQHQPNAAELAEFWSLIRYNDGHHIGHRLMNYVRERSYYADRWVSVLGHDAVPLKLINGLDDPVSGAHLVDACQQQFPQMDVTRLPGIGHYPQTEAPQQVLESFLTFIQPRLQQPD